MRVRQCLNGCAVAVAVAAAVWAGPIHDPQMGLDADTGSNPITGAMFVPAADGGGIFHFFNNTGEVITALGFGTLILPNLTSQQLSGVFSCNDQNTELLPNPFFTNCAIDYTASSGQLAIRFFGVGTGEFAPSGIPPLLPACQDTPDAPGCNIVGHFIVTLNDNFSTVGDVGGWSNTATPGIFLPGGPNFSVLEIDVAAPEPATAAMVCGALVCLIVLKRRKTA